MNDGTLVALDADVVMDGGAYLTLTPVVLSRGAIRRRLLPLGRGADPRARGRDEHAANGAFRSFGAPQTLFAIESHMDRIAGELGMDPLALRRMNAVKLGDVTRPGRCSGGVGSHEVLERTAKRAKYAEKRARYERENAAAEAAEHAGRSRRTDAGCAAASAWRSRCTAPASRQRRVEAQLARGARPDRGRPSVRAHLEHRDRAGHEHRVRADRRRGARHSARAGDRARARHRPRAGQRPDGRLAHADGRGRADREVREEDGEARAFAEHPIEGGGDFTRIAKRWLKERGPLRVEQRYQSRPASSGTTTPTGATPTACSRTRRSRSRSRWTSTPPRPSCCVTTAQDIGKAIHPVLCAGQIEGGTLQGLGWALMEEVRHKGTARSGTTS